jgi:hypothetical protein
MTTMKTTVYQAPALPLPAADRCTDLAGAVQAALERWQRLDLAGAHDEPERRRRWLGVVNELLRVEAELERDLCDCAGCRATRTAAARLRERLEALAGPAALPLPAEGDEVRLPVNVDVLEARARRLLANRSVTPIGRGAYLVHSPGGRHLVHAGRAAHWETDWSCTCAWSQPYPPDGRPGRGCTHVRAVREYRQRRAGGSAQALPQPAAAAQLTAGA